MFASQEEVNCFKEFRIYKLTDFKKSGVLPSCLSYDKVILQAGWTENWNYVKYSAMYRILTHIKTRIDLGLVSEASQRTQLNNMNALVSIIVFMHNRVEQGSSTFEFESQFTSFI